MFEAKRKDEKSIDEEEAVKVFKIFRDFSTDKQAFAIAFVNGMEFQRSISKQEDVHKQEVG